MSIVRSRAAALLAAGAAFSMSASPALADGWRGGGWGGRGWGGGGHRHHDNGDAGAIIAGLLLIGGIAAVASAASKADKQRRDRADSYPDNRPEAPSRDAPRYAEPGERDDTRSGPGTYGSGLTGAVDQCVDEVESARHRVESVDMAERSGDGWRVEGKADAGRTFSCLIDGDGRARSVTVDGQAA